MNTDERRFNTNGVIGVHLRLSVADMQKRTRFLIRALSLILALTAAAQTPAGRTPTGPALPRTADGKPNFNGIWQSMNTANWDLEDHSSRAGPIAATGAIGSEPAGLGII